MINALKDESPEVREKAAWALGLKGDKRAVDALIAARRIETMTVGYSEMIPTREVERLARG